VTAAPTPAPRLNSPLRALLVIVFLYLFLGGVKLLESGIKGLGADYTDALFESVSNPLAGLFVGVLATVLVQSSSVTTATIVGLVASGVLSVEAAVPMIMGANIGTTITNTIVALAHVRNTEEFRKAFVAATMHDFFNLLAVALLFPIEVATGGLSRAAQWLAEVISGGAALGGDFDSPVKSAVSWFAGTVTDGVDAVISNPTAAAVLAIVVGIALIFATLALITRNMRMLVATRIERSINAVLERSGMIGMLVGIIVTVSVQSSSITTSILIPLVASGVLLVRSAYPITLGANVGTTVTGLLAALGAGAVSGLTIALVHTLFNVTAIALLYPWKRVRYVPVAMAEWLAGLAVRRKTVALGYVVALFIVLPLVGIVVLR
jgi:sodium-dependent phosphate cotransporter